MSDEYHTMDELYEYRMLYNAHSARGWRAAGVPVVKSWRHSDGEPCFGGGWFIVVATLPTGQVSNHYAAEHWDLFDVPEADLPPAYDGHTPAEAAARLLAALRHLTAAPSADAEGLDEDGLTPVEQAVAKALWGRWAHPDPVAPTVLIDEDPRTVARFLRPFLAAPSATREDVDLTAVIAGVWDDGNAVGLDGWTGPERGSDEVDDYAVRARERAVTRALDAITPKEDR